MHPWVGAGPQDRRNLLDELGLETIDQLLARLPEAVRIDRLDLPPAQDETALRRAFFDIGLNNTTAARTPSFLGAGVYNHIRPAAVDAVLSRAEFFTSYTPYQPEISQGTLQALFEFQTLMTRLTGMEVSNASLYDGATALVEAALFAFRVLRTKRSRVVLAETVHPIYRSVLDAYAEPTGLEIVTVPAGPDGRLDLKALEAAVNGDTCCVAVQSPNFLGVVENLGAVSHAAHGVGALAVHVVTEALSMALLKAGGHFDFDVVCGEAQSFGVAPGYGGPHLGFFTCREKTIRQMPGRLCGETVDSEGDRAFCLTLSTREQHIRRAKATSNICTNQGLMALAATVWLEAVGGAGLRRLAQDNLSRAHELARRLVDENSGWRLAFPDSPFFNEFLIRGPVGGSEAARKAEQAGVLAGVPVIRWNERWPDGLLIAVTENNPVTDFDALIGALGSAS
ncbi:MAG: aminomethyl-transferring glycine dehydrogenase subunit GcvPA [Acidobacteriota bacterium]